MARLWIRRICEGIALTAIAILAVRSIEQMSGTSLSPLAMFLLALYRPKSA